MNWRRVSASETSKLGSGAVLVCCAAVTRARSSSSSCCSVALVFFSSASAASLASKAWLSAASSLTVSGGCPPVAVGAGMREGLYDDEVGTWSGDAE